MSMRSATPEDIDVVLELLRSDEEHLIGRPSRIGRSDLLQWLSRVDLDADSWLLEEDGRLVACGWVQTSGDLGWAIGAVHPEAKGHGIGGRLVERSEQRLREQGATRVHQVAFAGDTRAPVLFATHGYREVRRFYEMTIELDGPPPAPVLPDDLTIETFDEASLREFHEALDESFQDHWEHHSPPSRSGGRRSGTRRISTRRCGFSSGTAPRSLRWCATSRTAGREAWSRRSACAGRGADAG
jgi:mycothiol synthase